MANNPKVKALARQASAKIKALTQAHQTQIEAIYRQFQEQAADIRPLAKVVGGVLWGLNRSDR